MCTETHVSHGTLTPQLTLKKVHCVFRVSVQLFAEFCKVCDCCLSGADPLRLRWFQHYL